MLKTKAKRPVMFWIIVSILVLPVLHFHPRDMHEHTGYGTHSHGLVHADFFPRSADHHADDSGAHEDANAIFSQVSLAALVARGLTPLLTLLPLSDFDLHSESLESMFSSHAFAKRSQEERSPPFLQGLLSKPSTRSPPRFFI
jgi:hypothetical protein